MNKDDRPIFPQLKGTGIPHPLTGDEMTEMWYAVRAGIRRPRRRFPYRTTAVLAAASLLLTLSLFLLPRESGTTDTGGTPPAMEAIALPSQEVMPLIEEWEGDASMMYEGNHDTMQVAFIVDSNVQW